jgi:hypothetical protein
MSPCRDLKLSDMLSPKNGVAAGIKNRKLLSFPPVKGCSSPVIRLVTAWPVGSKGYCGLVIIDMKTHL